MRRGLALLTFCLAFLFAAPARADGPFIMFFDTGSARFTPATEAILDNLFAAIRTGDIRALEIRGGADRVGSERANFDLSRRRAEAVRAALVTRGMSPRVRVTIVAAGETQPISPTGDGVPDPQNRNVQVIILAMCMLMDGTRATEGDCATPLHR